MPHPLPKTLTCTATEGRLHVYLRQTDATRALGNVSVTDIDGRHFDFQQDRKYVLAPHSVHPSGREYKIVDPSPIVDCPEWLAAWITDQKGKYEPIQKPFESTGKPIGGLVIGEFGSTITQEQFERWLDLHGEQVYPPTKSSGRLQYIRVEKCPWSDEHTNKDGQKDFAIYLSDGKPGVKCQHSHTKQWADYRDFLVGRTGHNFNMHTGAVLQPQTPTALPKTKMSIGTFKYSSIEGTHRDFVLSPLQDTNPPQDGWFPRGDLSAIGGSSGSGKTTLAIEIFRLQKNKEKVFEHKTFGLSFLILMADRGENANKRTIERMGINPATVPIKRIKGQGQDALTAIKDGIESGEIPQIVFVEGADMLQEDPSKMNMIVPFITELHELARHYHIALIVSLGSPKMTSKDFYQIRRDQLFGSVAWGRMMETIIILGYDENDDTSAKRVAAVMNHNGPAEKLNLIFDHGVLVEDTTPPEPDGITEWIKAQKIWFSAKDASDATDESLTACKDRIKSLLGLLDMKVDEGKSHKKLYLMHTAALVLDCVKLDSIGGAQ
jgi:hypothetical protein